jgi:hypothetical protein
MKATASTSSMARATRSKALSITACPSPRYASDASRCCADVLLPEA